MQIDVQLINESQYGTRLNSAVEHNRRGEFGLLLAMLSADARDMAQFQLESDSNLEDVLKRQLQVINQQPLLQNVTYAEESIVKAQTFVGESPRSFQLRQALQPDALVIRGKESLEMTEVLANCDWATRLKAEDKLQIPQLQAKHFADQLAEQRQLALVV